MVGREVFWGASRMTNSRRHCFKSWSRLLVGVFGDRNKRREKKQQTGSPEFVRRRTILLTLGSAHAEIGSRYQRRSGAPIPLSELYSLRSTVGRSNRTRPLACSRSEGRRRARRGEAVRRRSLVASMADLSAVWTSSSHSIRDGSKNVNGKRPDVGSRNPMMQRQHAAHRQPEVIPVEFGKLAWFGESRMLVGLCCNIGKL